MNRLDEQIKSLEYHLAVLKEDRKLLDRYITENRQLQAELRNEIRRLKDERRRAGE